MKTKRVTEADLCPWPHKVDMLVGVKAGCLEDLPKTCTCGTTLAYADQVVFVSEPKVTGMDPNVLEVTPLLPSQVREAVPSGVI